MAFLWTVLEGAGPPGCPRAKTPSPRSSAASSRRTATGTPPPIRSRPDPRAPVLPGPPSSSGAPWATPRASYRLLVAELAETRARWEGGRARPVDEARGEEGPIDASAPAPSPAPSPATSTWFAPSRSRRGRAQPRSAPRDGAVELRETRPSSLRSGCGGSDASRARRTPTRKTPEPSPEGATEDDAWGSEVAPLSTLLRVRRPRGRARADPGVPGGRDRTVAPRRRRPVRRFSFVRRVGSTSASGSRSAALGDSSPATRAWLECGGFAAAAAETIRALRIRAIGRRSRRRDGTSAGRSRVGGIGRLERVPDASVASRGGRRHDRAERAQRPRVGSRPSRRASATSGLDEKSVVSAAATDGRDAPGESAGCARRRRRFARGRAAPSSSAFAPPPRRSRGWTCAWTRWTSFGARRVATQDARAAAAARTRSAGDSRRFFAPPPPRTSEGRPRDALAALRGRLRPRRGAGAGTLRRPPPRRARSAALQGLFVGAEREGTRPSHGVHDDARDGCRGGGGSLLAEGAAATGGGGGESSNARAGFARASSAAVLRAAVDAIGDEPPDERGGRSNLSVQVSSSSPASSSPPGGDGPPSLAAAALLRARTARFFAVALDAHPRAGSARRSAARTLGACCSTRTCPTASPRARPRAGRRRSARRSSRRRRGSRGARARRRSAVGIARGVRRFKRRRGARGPGRARGDSRRARRGVEARVAAARGRDPGLGAREAPRRHVRARSGAVRGGGGPREARGDGAAVPRVRRG